MTGGAGWKVRVSFVWPSSQVQFGEECPQQANVLESNMKTILIQPWLFSWSETLHLQVPRIRPQVGRLNGSFMVTVWQYLCPFLSKLNISTLLQLQSWRVVPNLRLSLKIKSLMKNQLFDSIKTTQRDQRWFYWDSHKITFAGICTVLKVVIAQRK